MSRNLNKCSFIGRLGKDPDIRTSPSGVTFANISIACGDDYVNKQTNEKVEQTNWIPVTFAGRLAEVVRDYVFKGSKIYVEGKFITRKYQDNNGQDRYVTEIKASNMEMLDSRNTNGQGSQPQQQRPQQQHNSQQSQNQQQDQGNNRQSNQQMPPQHYNDIPPVNYEDFDTDIPF